MSVATGETALAGTNLELKARLASVSAARERLGGIGAELEGVERQDDRYFTVSAGRLKLRISSRDGAHLVLYQRPELGRFRESRFHRLPVVDPEGLAESLTTMLGVRARVVKTREVWWWRDVRIHLDEVEGRGSFIEFEARVDRIGHRREAAARLDQLCAALAIAPEQAVHGSYGEMPCPMT